MFQNKSFDVGGVSLNCGVGPDHGRPLVMLHGVTRCWQDFVPLLPSLSSRWRVLALDHRGHGRSARADAYLVTDYVNDSAEFLRSAIGEPAVVYGHSLGAMVAAGVAADVPEKVRAVVLEDPPFATMAERIKETPFHSMFAGMLELTRRGLDVESLARELAELQIVSPNTGESTRLGDVRDPTSLRFSAKCLSQLDPLVLEPIVAGEWLNGYDQQNVLRRVQCPALLLQAEVKAGGMLPDPDAQRVAELMPHGIRVKVPGVGHLIHWMETEATLRLVNGFLESL